MEMTKLELIKQIQAMYSLTAQDCLNISEALEGIEWLNKRKRSQASAECIAYFAGMVRGEQNREMRA